MADRPGILPHQLIVQMMEAGNIKNASLNAAHAASLDLAITDEVFRLRGSYVPRPSETIEGLVQRGALYKHPLDLPLEVNGTYLIRLAESLALPRGIRARASATVSIGGINVSTRLVADRVSSFDELPCGYSGSLWLEVISHSFPLQLHVGDKLHHLRFIYGQPQFSGIEHRWLADKYALLRDGQGAAIPSTDETTDDGMPLSVDLSTNEQIGWRARPSAWSVLDTAKRDHDPLDFFEPVMQTRHAEIAIHHGSFFLLSSKESIHVPPTMTAELMDLEPSRDLPRSFVSRSFDPGWSGAATLEISNPGQDIILRNGQPLCRIAFQRLLSKSDVPDVSRSTLHVPRSTLHDSRAPRLAKWFKT